MITDSVTIMPTRIVASAMVGLGQKISEDMQESIPDQMSVLSEKDHCRPRGVIDDSIEVIDDASEAASENLLSDEEFTIPGGTQ